MDLKGELTNKDLESRYSFEKIKALDDLRKQELGMHLARTYDVVLVK